MVFCLDGLSKRAALPQLKLGWCSVSGPAPWVNEALRRLENIADSYLSVATPIQRALAELLPHGDVNRLALLERIRHNRDQLRTCVAGSAATLLSLEGGWYAILRLPETHSADQWAQLLVDAGVLVQPGWLFDLEGSYVVLSLIVDPLQFEVGARRLVDCVQRAS